MPAAYAQAAVGEPSSIGRDGRLSSTRRQARILDKTHELLGPVIAYAQAHIDISLERTSMLVGLYSSICPNGMDTREEPRIRALRHGVSKAQTREKSKESNKSDRRTAEVRVGCERGKTSQIGVRRRMERRARGSHVSASAGSLACERRPSASRRAPGKGRTRRNGASVVRKASCSVASRYPFRMPRVLIPIIGPKTLEQEGTKVCAAIGGRRAMRIVPSKAR